MGKGRKPCCDKSKVKRGAWTPAEDLKLISFVQKYGHDNWRSLPKLAGLARCGKSCRLRWINYLRPDLKRGNFTKEEEEAIIILHQTLGNKWSKIASNFPGRTDNEIKNLWNTHLKKRAAKQQDSGGATKKPRVSEPTISTSSSSSSTSSTATNSTPAAGGDGFEALLSDEFSPPANFGLAGDIPVEIPFELDVDFWSFLDGLNPFEEQNNNNNDGGHEKYSSNLGETEDTKWLRYIENELGLEPTGISPEVNSEIGYYHLWPSL